MGAAWERHAMCESAFKLALELKYWPTPAADRCLVHLFHYADGQRFRKYDRSSASGELASRNDEYISTIVEFVNWMFFFFFVVAFSFFQIIAGMFVVFTSCFLLLQS
jgi:hypothetical protein